jgi:acyl-CoA synthetase (AMP-forming)/AMP-acid ligase II
VVQPISGRVRTVPDVVRAAAERHPDLDAFVDGPRRLTFAGLNDAAAAVAAFFADRGLGKGDVLCLVLPSSIEFAVCYHAAMRLGAVTSAINPRLGPREMASIMARTQPGVTVVADHRGDRPQAEGGQVLTAADVAAAMTGDPLARGPRLSAGDAVAVVWTSGTTGQPKGAVFDHDNLKAVFEGSGVLSAPGDRRLSPVPFAHVAFMTRAWDEVANLVASIIVPTPWRAGEALRLIEAERVTVGQGVPTQWALMLASPAFADTDLSSLRLISTGSAAMAPSLLHELRRRAGCPVVVRYTSTEASLTTGTGPDDSDEVVADTVGRGAANVEVEVVDDDGRPVAAGQVGAVRCRSGAVMRGYWHDPVRTDEVLAADGWLSTGDLGCFDAAGNLRLAGRRTEMYVRGGYNVYPAEVEAVLGGHPGVQKVAVVGVPDSVLGEVGLAAVVLDPADPAGPPTLDGLRAWCWRTLADYKAPDRLVVVEELPLTSMLKVDKAALLALVHGGAGLDDGVDRQRGDPLASGPGTHI